MANRSPRPTGSALRRGAIGLVRWLASLKLAVVLIALLAIVLGGATFLEKAKGREYVQWYVYHSCWFATLLGILAFNILMSAALRFPWGRKRIGFLVTHVGLLVLLAGALETFFWGIEGFLGSASQLGFLEGQTANVILIADRCQFAASWEDGASGRGRWEFLFSPGPVDWPTGETLHVGQSGGIGVDVLKFYRHARVEETWVEDRQKAGSPAIHFVLSDPDGHTAGEDWLVAGEFGGQEYLGPTKFEFQRAPVDSLLEDFLKPPAADVDKDGVLSVHYKGHVQRVLVSKNIGKKIPVGDGKVQVEIVEYLPNAKPDQNGRFVTRGNDPLNPLLELKVYLPDKPQPVRQIAFAKLPLLNLDGMHGWACPVKFWYHHPAVVAESEVAFLQTSDGKLYYRVGQDGKYTARGQVTKDQPIEIARQFKIAVTEHLVHARHEVNFYPLELAPGESEGPEPAALVSVSAGGKSQQFWLQRNGSEYGSRRLQTPEGVLDFRFGSEQLPLGFALRAERFERGANPGGMGFASYASYVRLIDPHRRIDEDHKISMNSPLTYGKFTFYQSGLPSLGNGKLLSILSVAYDPGQFLKYLGSAMICLGISLMFYGKLPRARKTAKGTEKGQRTTGSDSRLVDDKEKFSPACCVPSK